MHVIGVQLDTVWESKSASIERVSALLSGRRVEEGSLIVLPELFATGFTMNAAALAEEAGGESEQFLAGLARQHRSFVIGGLPVGPVGSPPTNQSVVFGPAGEALGRYSKQQPFMLGGEGAAYGRGDRPVVVQIGEWKVGLFICYDLRFPELFRRYPAGQEPELFVVIANWPNRRLQHWLTLLQARAIENQAYVVGVNRAGTDPNHVYPGRSVVVDPHGVILADAGDAEGIVRAELDLGRVTRWRGEFPALKDRRPF